MPTRIGIELSPVTCRIVEIDGRVAKASDAPETRVRSYGVFPAGSGEWSAKLASLRRRHAAVVVWGVPCDHRQVMVDQAGYEKMRAEAIEAAERAGVATDGMLADITPAGAASDGASRRPVVLAIAESRDLSFALQPLLDAGVRIRSVVTPADALTSLARTRQVFSIPDAIEAYVALEEMATAVALVRDGALMAARELPWGYLDDITDLLAPRRREDIATRLANDLAEFFSMVGAAPGSVRQVSICGGLPELRSMTVPVMERLDVEVETLDSLFGIDSARLPEPALDFRDRLAELRLAWAVATDWRAPINLLRHRQRTARKTLVARAAVAAGVVAGLGIGWRIERSNWWQSTASPVVQSPPPRTKVGGAPPTLVPSRSTPPPVAATKVPALVPPPVAATKVPAPVPPPVAAPKVPALVPPPVVATKVPAPVPPPVAAPKVPALVPPPVTATKVPAPVPPPTAATKVPPPLARAAVPVSPPPASPTKPPERVGPSSRVVSPPPPPAVRPTEPVRPRPVETPPPPRASALSPSQTRETPLPPTPPVPSPPPRGPDATTPSLTPPSAPPREATPPRRQEPPVAAPQRPAPAPLPFDAVLGTILYSSDRKLAIIDGRIVGPGDDVKGARIVDITPSTVLLRDAQGRLRSLTLGTPIR